MVNHSTERLQPEGKGRIMQVRPKAGEGSPNWYAPNRDLLHQFPKWITGALARLNAKDLTEELGEDLGKMAKELAATINMVSAGDLAGNPEGMEERIKLVLTDSKIQAVVGSALLTHLLWKYWEFAGDVSLRQEGPLEA